jgi:hypothetical protein
MTWRGLYNDKPSLTFFLVRLALSHLRLLGSLSVASYDSQWLRWKYSYPPPHGVDHIYECFLNLHSWTTSTLLRWIPRCLHLHSTVSLRPLVHYFILLFKCVVYLRFSTLTPHHYFPYREFIIFFSFNDFDFFVRFRHYAKNELIALLKFGLLKCLDSSISWYSNFNLSLLLSRLLSVIE